jgi:hypothetical protein
VVGDFAAALNPANLETGGPLDRKAVPDFIERSLYNRSLKVRK